MRKVAVGIACWLAMAAPAAAVVLSQPLPEARPLPALALQAEGGPALPTGRWTWLYLGFANCPDVCPNTLGYLAEQHKRLARPDEVQVLFVSVDPQRDTPATLAKYAGYFSPAFRGATGDRPALDALAAALGTRYVIYPPSKPGGSYGVGHPNTVFVLDPQGRLAATYQPAGDALSNDFNALDKPVVTAAPANGVPAWCTPDVLMERARAMGSGTSRVPAASPMRMWSLNTENWLWMFHGNLIGGYNYQGGPRGDLTWAAENWQMAMGTRPVGPGLLDLRLMTSLEPLTLPPGGTPQLFQTGETYRFNPLIDRQHPHDLIMELAARYSLRLDEATDVFLYGGPAGEPALGPSAFMHRASAADNPWAPLGHHQQDATHVTYGVATLGARRGPFTLEGSVFNGKEPDEYRYDMDLRVPDSYSGRLSWAPIPQMVLQVSHGHLAEPERLHPGDVERTTASVATVFETPVGPWSGQLTWGQNLEAHPPLTGLYARQSYGLESQLDAWRVWHFYTRIESLDKTGLPPGPALNHTLRRVEAATIGLVKDLDISDRFDLGLGGDVTAYGIQEELWGPYGFNPVSFRVYLRLRPPTMNAGAPMPAGMQMPAL